MTSAIPVQCSTSRAIKHTGNWSFLCVRNEPVEDRHIWWYVKDTYLNVTNSQKGPAPSGLDISTGRARHRYRSGQDSWVRFPLKPGFFQAFFCHCSSSVNNCDELKITTYKCLSSPKQRSLLTEGVHNFGERQTSDQDITRGTRDTRGVPTIADYTESVYRFFSAPRVSRILWVSRDAWISPALFIHQN